MISSPTDLQRCPTIQVKKRPLSDQYNISIIHDLHIRPGCPFVCSLGFAGEVALPGGKVEEGDANDIETALREAKEEIGLDPSLVNVVTVLESFTTKVMIERFVNNFQVSFCVGKRVDQFVL